MSKDRDGSVRARLTLTRTYIGRYKYAGHWYQVLGENGHARHFVDANRAREAAYAMYNVAVNGGKHQ